MLKGILQKLFIFLFFCVAMFSCYDKEKKVKMDQSSISNEVFDSIVPNIIPNSVVIELNDTILFFESNVFASEFQNKPDILYLGKKQNKLSITVPTDNYITILGGNPMKYFFYSLKIAKGDSLMIDTREVVLSPKESIGYPVFDIKNRNERWSELNFDYLLFNQRIADGAIGIDSTKNYLAYYYNNERAYTSSLSLLDSLSINGALSDKFYKDQTFNQKVEFARNEIVKALSTRKTVHIENFEIDLNDELQRENELYIDFLRNVLQYRYFKGTPRMQNSVKFDYVFNNETFLNNDMELAVLDSYLKSIYLVEGSKFEDYRDKFKLRDRNKFYHEKWEKALTAFRSNEDQINLNNRDVGILTNLVSDNQLTFEEVLNREKGRIILVDFWASWCAPCRKEIPFLKKLKGAFSKDDLTIVEISIDHDYLNWKRAARMEEIDKEENSYIIANWEKSNLRKNFNVKTIPRYLLFDRNGKVLNQDAPRPSSDALYEEIKTAL